MPNLEQFVYPSTDKCINKLCTMKYESAIKRNVLLTNTVIWISLKNIPLRERSQTKTTYHSIYF